MRYWKSDCNRKCCGTCEHYTGKREVTTGFYGEEVEVDVENKGLCSKQWNNPEVKEYDSCFSYEKAKAIEVAQKQVELKEFKRKQAQQQRDNEKKLKEIEREKNRANTHLETNSNTMSTSSSSTSNSSSKTGILFGGIGIVIIAIIVLITSLVNSFTPKLYTDTLTGQNKVIAEYIVANGEKDTEYNDYSIQKNITVDGKNYEFQIRYFNKEDKKQNFVTYITYNGSETDDFEYYEGIFYFNYGDKTSFSVSGIADYEDGWFFVYYNGVSYNTFPNMTYERAQTSNITNLEITNEMKNDSISGVWKCIEICASATNDFLKTINSSYQLW